MIDMKNAGLALGSLAVMIAGAPAMAIDGSVNQAPASSNVLAAQAGNGGRGGFLSGIFGCSAGGNKQVGVAVVGGVLGGFLGNRIAGRGSRTLGTVIGGALGAAAGSSIGCKLQRNDQAKAEKAMEDAVATGKDQSWESAETGASGKVQVGNAALSGAGLADLKLADGVEPAEGYAKVGASYTASAAANIRSTPGLEGKIIGKLTEGQLVWVPASVQNAPWYLISDQGVGQGYVSNALLKKQVTQTASNCRMVKQTVDTPESGSASETYQACKGGDGRWVMTRV